MHRASATAKNTSKNASKRTYQHDTSDNNTHASGQPGYNQHASDMQADNLATTNMQADNLATTTIAHECKLRHGHKHNIKAIATWATHKNSRIPPPHCRTHLSLENTEVHVFNITWCKAGASGQAGRLAGKPAGRLTCRRLCCAR